MNSQTPHHAAGKHILHVDDEVALLSLTKRALERLGYRFSGFSTHSEALGAFRASPETYDLIITDMNMPGSNGLEFARDVLTLKPDVPVALSSGYVTPELERNALDIGIRAVIAKPGTVPALLERVRSLVSGPEV